MALLLLLLLVMLPGLLKKQQHLLKLRGSAHFLPDSLLLLAAHRASLQVGGQS
jgi:hypothetical protein